MQVIIYNIFAWLNDLENSFLRVLGEGTMETRRPRVPTEPMFLLTWQTDILCNTYTEDVDLIGTLCEWTRLEEICSFDLCFIGTYG